MLLLSLVEKTKKGKMKNITLVTLGVLFSFLGFISLIILVLPNLTEELAGAIVSSILILTGGCLIISEIVR